MKEDLQRMDKFIEEFLYSPSSGYYMVDANQKNDYLTAPQISGLFSDFVSEFMVSKAEEDQAEKPIFVDLGGGTGKIAISLLKIIENSERFKFAEVYLLEKSFKRAEEALNENPSIKYIDNISEIPEDRPVYGIANEFFDAFPPRVFKIKDRKIYEAYVKKVNALISIEYLEVRRLPQFIKGILFEAHSYIKEGIVEIQESAFKFMNLLKKFESFHMLLFDYGYEFPEIKRFPEGTLVGYRNHHALNNFLELKKPADITCHVNFSLLKRWLSESGFRIVTFVNQGSWLIDNGFLGFFEKRARLMDQLTFLSESAGFKKVVLPGYMGDAFKAIYAVKSPDPK